MTRFCTYAITDRDSNPLMGSTAVSVLKHDEILHVCNYYLRFESTYGLYCSLCFQNMTRFCTYAITIRDSNPLMGSTAVAVFKHDEILHVCNYYLRFESTYGLNCSRCFQKCSRFCTYAITIRDSNPLMGSTAVSVLKHDEILHVCNY
ncbi:hypothetical protein CEXT_20491 [Caerostris extrusa]|uniref:Uncharacterized protein n=1 Tax=Caerostris extrusa TaxID=172846 RepID=A0AAV4WS87_CAEEX|nr:hypothetical protein CEXT_20491 [Caerostris extrusa]